MDSQHTEKRCRQKWKATLFLLCGVLGVLYSGFAFSSPYISPSLWEAYHHEALMRVAMVLAEAAFWGMLPVVLCVWLCPPTVSRGVQILWWTVALLSQWGWVYLIAH